MQIATSRYHAANLIEASGLAPVGISVGSARFLRYELAGNIGPLAPYGENDDGVPLRKIESRAAFDSLYRERLSEFGVPAIRALFKAFANAYKSDGVVLLCFEDVLGIEDEHCHRRTFAQWWEFETGEVVPELAPAQLTTLAFTGPTLPVGGA